MIAKRNIQNYRLRKILLVIFAFIFISIILASVIFYFWASSDTLGKEKLSKIITFPQQSAATPQKEIFTIMTFNIGYLSGMYNNLPLKPPKILFIKDMKMVLDLLSNIQPDIVGIQEIDFYSRRSYFQNQLQMLADRGGFSYAAQAINWDKKYVPFPYWPPAAHFGPVLSGQAVLSRWPITKAVRHVLQELKNKPFYFKAFYLDRLLQIAKVKINGRILVVLNVHLDAFDPLTRRGQVIEVINFYRRYKERYPTFLIGDFNSIPPNALQTKNFPDEPETDFSKDQTIKLILKEPNLKAAELDILTFPAINPTRKLDYIFYNPEQIHVHQTITYEFCGSDHLPVIVQFSFK